MPARSLRRLGALVLAISGLWWFEPLTGLATGPGFNLATQVKGEVWVLRDQRKPWKLRVGHYLWSTDRLRVTQGSLAQVLCQNASLWNPKAIGTFAVNQGCRATGRIVLKPTNGDRTPTRSSNNPTLPFIISPRNTVILEAQPLLRWNPVAGVKRYQVRVNGPGVDWQTEVSQSQVMYGGKQVFQPGMRYRVIVTSGNGESSQGDGAVGFSVLDGAAVARVKADILGLQQQELSDEAQVLSIAHLERSNELYASAINRLEMWLGRRNKSAAVSQLAGDLNRQVGLPGLARDHYVVGLEMMRRDGNLAGQAEVLNSLGQVDRDSDRLKDAIGWLEEAQKRYRELGDEERVKQLDTELTDLRERV
jgi:hypothetical protein